MPFKQTGNDYDSVGGEAISVAVRDLIGTLKADAFDRIEEGRPSRVSTAHKLDNKTERPNHTGMTDINRQQVADMLAASEAKVDARLANFDTSVKTGFADLKTGFAEMKTEMQKMRGDFEKQSHDSTKWIIGSVFGMISLGVAIIGVMINLNKAEKPAAAPAQPAAVVITVPGATVAPAQPAAK